MRREHELSGGGAGAGGLGSDPVIEGAKRDKTRHAARLVCVGAPVTSACRSVLSTTRLEKGVIRDIAGPCHGASGPRREC